MTNQGDFTAGDVLQASDLNAFTPVTIVRQNGLSVPNSTNTTPAFNIEDIDVGGWHSGTNGYVTVPYNGVYLVTANVRNLNGTTRGILVITVNGASVADEDTAQGNDHSAAVVMRLSATNTVSMFVWQQSGTTRSVDVRLTVQLVRRT